MTNQPDKQLIRRRFARSLATYSDNAAVQNQIAGRLMAELVEVAGREFDRIFEIGIGSGLFTELIVEKLGFRELFLNDIVEECSACAGRIVGSSFIPGDIESLAEFPGNLDLIVSNAVFQWLHDLPHTLSRLADALVPGGILAFSTFGPDNFSEIRSLTGVSLGYYSLAELKELLSECFDVISAQEKSYFLEFSDPHAVLHHMKSTGVTAAGGKRWTRTTLAKFSNEYISRFSSPSGVVLTYQPITIIAAAKS